LTIQRDVIGHVTIRIVMDHFLFGGRLEPIRGDSKHTGVTTLIYHSHVTS